MHYQQPNLEEFNAALEIEPFLHPQRTESLFSNETQIKELIQETDPSNPYSGIMHWRKKHEIWGNEHNDKLTLLSHLHSEEQELLDMKNDNTLGYDQHFSVLLDKKLRIVSFLVTTLKDSLREG